MTELEIFKSIVGFAEYTEGNAKLASEFDRSIPFGLRGMAFLMIFSVFLS